MTNTLRTYRTLLGIAAVILIVTGALHATGLPSLSETLADSGLPADWTPVFKGLWLMFSIHLVIVAGLLIVLAVVPAGRAPLAVTAAMPIADTVLLLLTVGVFIGSIMTGMAAVFTVSALIAQPAEASKK